ncbi:MAG: FliI/YscN family ATPase [Bdellovibrionales bacterium]|nr:FliI/YscN family ATPase [Bdellovibrionales bacterium]
MDFSKYIRAIEDTHLHTEIGKVTRVIGTTIEGHLPGATIGSLCRIRPGRGLKDALGEVVGFRDRHVVIMPLGEVRGVGLGSEVILEKSRATIPVGQELLGRVINGICEPIDSRGGLRLNHEYQLYRETVNPMARPRIETPMDLGVRSINGFTTVGRGQRVGIMAGSGVGKSVLLGMMARSATADVNVIALVGERGRELREFIESDLGPEGLKKSVVIVATSDQPPLLRMRAAFVATAIAEYFADQGKNVLMMMDSVTRFAMAQREIGLASGEPPATRGYTPSVFSLLPKLLERAGQFNHGSITGLYTVLVEADDMDDPIGDAVRSIVDGHIVLSRRLAQRGQYPAVDVLQSLSRVMRAVTSPSHGEAAQKMRELISTYKEAEDLIQIGAYKRGSSQQIDQAVDLRESIDAFLRQSVGDATSLKDTVEIMKSIVGMGR